MNDAHDPQPDLQHAYDRLGSALEPPRDAGTRIGRRIVVRRHRRRAALAGVAALAVVGGTGAAVALTGSGGRGDVPVATDEGTPATSPLVLTRPDGSTYEFSDVTVSCDPPTTTAGDPMGEGGGKDRVWLWSPIDVTGSEDSDDLAVRRPFVYVEARVAAFDAPRTLELPVDGPGDSGSFPITVFVADPSPGTGGAEANEVSSAVSGEGTIRVLRASCDPTPVLELEVDTSLGSEVDGPSLRLSGSHR
ncbi:hypothetical protein [Nocardioides flavescens]|uniref:Uncharacterized protein n=1 Tax=Nocardioides flavescens TaxID=2691959 RepID=A0A6L7EUV7_9ACTN|nr:hypothetical protein [Nocardioides flavescens]MXG89238.1 hypothetical protein [Nocardioides flavescens]